MTTSIVCAVSGLAWFLFAERCRRRNQGMEWAVGIVCGNVYLAAAFVAAA